MQHVHTPVDARLRAPRNRRRIGAVTLTAAVVIGGGVAIAVPAMAAPAIGETGQLTVTYQRDVGDPVFYDPARNNGGYGGSPLMKSTDVNGVELDPALPDLQQWFDGGIVRTLPGNPWGYQHGADLYPHFMGVMDPIPAPACDAEQVTVQIQGRMTNAGPGTTWGSTGSVAINHNNATVAYQWWGGEFPPGHVLGFNRSATVPLADLQDGKVRVSATLESYQAIPEPEKAWDLSDFGATYTVHCSPSAEDADLRVGVGEAGFLALDGKVTTDTVDPDWTTLRLVDSEGAEVTEFTIDGVGTYTVDLEGKGVSFAADPAYAGGELPGVTYRIDTTVINRPGFVSQTAEASLYVTIAGQQTPTPTPSPTQSETPGVAPKAADLSTTTSGAQAVSVDPVAAAEAGEGTLIDPASVRLRNAAGDPVTELTVDGQGTFAVDPESGVITFTPLDGFVGVASATYILADDEGQVAEATVTVEVTAAAVVPGPSTPSASPAAAGTGNGSGALAQTGSDAGDALPVTLGAALVTMLLGAGAVLVARRRRMHG